MTDQSPKTPLQGYEYRKKLPNVLTAFRFFLVPFLVLLLLEPTPLRMTWATVIFIVASVTDWLDGYLARIYHAETILGKLLDPLADKVLTMSALVMMVGFPEEMRVPAWMVVILLAREMIITGLRSVAAVQGVVMAASGSAKLKTAWTMVSIVLLLCGIRFQVSSLEIHAFDLGMGALWVALILSLVSGFQYAIKLRSCFI